ncbi:HNH endonuclease [Cryobacterium sp. TMT1-21]|uniref:HNH endonuclease signature motif containing protein n=1 Tax=unclassified Cryobacterium TaxID=2649013 RepID=UPI00106BB1F6|nr:MULTISPECIES: HNH endonuclease signature motif containing protein [unclassified Cryobacterium]TFD15975.1 HNH endonuclease [Cryobacterium sp. TMT1-21]TFD38298.1 HNH endonuclease [Cryobacterium sp. TMT2-10]
MKPSIIEEREAMGRHFDAIAEAERDIAVAFARRAERVEEARRFGQAIAHHKARVPGARWDAREVAEREFSSELACTIRVPQRTAENLVAECRALAVELPATRAALASGEISYRHAQVVVNQAWSVPEEGRAEFEAAVLKSAGTLTASKLKYNARILRERWHPETIRARHQKSVKDRAVFFEPEPDGMASLTFYASAEKAQAAHERITLMALSLQCAEEDRTLTQLKADVFEDLILDGVTPSGLGKGIRGSVNITVPVFSLMGLNDEPAHMEGYGPIDADTARRIAAGAPSFTRLLVHPETGVVLSVGRDRYKVPKDLKKYLRVRDEICRLPGCNRSAAHSDIDHSLDWQFNGLTAEDNLAHLCPPCHALKSETGWTVKHLEDGVLQWRSPSGRAFMSEPATVIRAVEPEPPPGESAKTSVPQPSPF